MRDYSPQFVSWLRGQNFIGVFDGTRIAFPVADVDGKIVGCHWRRDEDGSWRYHPNGTRVTALVVGDLRPGCTILAFESQWDMLATLNAVHHHIHPVEATVAIATRGASNSRLLAGICPADATVYAFGQNDAAGQNWVAGIATECGCKCFHAATPATYKDVNDWTKAGATADDIYRAIKEAQPIAPAPAGTGSAAAPQPRLELLDLGEEEGDALPEPFPLDALPPSMGGMAAAIARIEHVPDRLTGVCVLGLVSAAIGAGLELQSDTQKTVRGNLYLFAAAETGTGKSRAFEPIAAPLLDHQQWLQERFRKELSPIFQSQLKAAEAKIKRYEREIGRENDPAQCELLREQLQFRIAERDDFARQNIPPVLFVQDITTERLAAMVYEQGEVLFSGCSDCRKIIENIDGRYSKNDSTDVSFYLSAFTGEPVRVDRGSRPPVDLRRPCLGLLWYGQSDLVARMLDEESLSASGFLPRLLICDTHAVPQLLSDQPESVPTGIFAAWSALLTTLLSAYHRTGVRHVVQPSAEARKAFIEYHNSIVYRRRSDLRDVTGFAARWCENAFRLALVLHAGFHGAEAHQHVLELSTADAAIRLSQWFSRAQLAILAKGRVQAAQKVELEVIDLLRTRPEVTARDVTRARIVTTAQDAHRLLNRIETAGIITGRDFVPDHGGRPTRIYRLVKNPLAK